MEWTSPQRHMIRTSRGKYSIGQAFNGVNYTSVPQEGVSIKIFERPSPVSAMARLYRPQHGSRMGYRAPDRADFQWLR